MIVKAANNSRSCNEPFTGTTDNSVAVAIEAYTSWLSQAGKASSTITNAKRHITAIVCDVIECDRIEQLDTDIVVQFIEHQENHGFAGKTIRTQLAELKRFSKWLVRSGRIKSDPIASVTFEVDEDESTERAQIRFQRLFKMIEFVSASRFGVSLEDINRACCEDRQVCLRTTRRDVDLLVAVGTFHKDRHSRFDRGTRLDSIKIKLNPYARLSQLAGRSAS